MTTNLLFICLGLLIFFICCSICFFQYFYILIFLILFCFISSYILYMFHFYFLSIMLFLIYVGVLLVLFLFFIVTNNLLFTRRNLDIFFDHSIIFYCIFIWCFKTSLYYYYYFCFASPHILTSFITNNDLNWIYNFNDLLWLNILYVKYSCFIILIGWFFLSLLILLAIFVNYFNYLINFTKKISNIKYSVGAGTFISFNDAFFNECSYLIYGLICNFCLIIIILCIVYLVTYNNREIFYNKADLYECGFQTFKTFNQDPIFISFYIFGLLFLIFDIEILFLFPYGATFINLSMFSFLSFHLFINFLIFGLIYEIQRGLLTIQSITFSNT